MSHSLAPPLPRDLTRDVLNFWKRVRNICYLWVKLPWNCIIPCSRHSAGSVLCTFHVRYYLFQALTTSFVSLAILYQAQSMRIPAPQPLAACSKRCVAPMASISFSLDAMECEGSKTRQPLRQYIAIPSLWFAHHLNNLKYSVGICTHRCRRRTSPRIFRTSLYYDWCTMVAFFVSYNLRSYYFFFLGHEERKPRDDIYLI